MRIAALHALASAAGLERAAKAGGAAPSGRGLPPTGPLDPSAAALPAHAEQALRVGSYQAAASSGAAQRSPCDALVSLGAQPVPELAVASYRAAAALALRPWFAAELCSSTALLAAVTDPATTTGHETTLWRQALLASLWATAKVSYPKGNGAQTALQPVAAVTAPLACRLTQHIVSCCSCPASCCFHFSCILFCEVFCTPAPCSAAEPARHASLLSTYEDCQLEPASLHAYHDSLLSTF